MKSRFKVVFSAFFVQFVNQFYILKEYLIFLHLHLLMIYMYHCTYRLDRQKCPWCIDHPCYFGKGGPCTRDTFDGPGGSSLFAAAGGFKFLGECALCMSDFSMRDFWPQLELQTRLLLHLLIETSKIFYMAS